ncbi:uncharacterized protein LOC135224351 isoform X2 [Macrobrachium nipponense]|uniref:uncharacterized protein LOC135224351 isoform X2 n=1 Tax=Macrobrachium nipponense TaxID=159736 RepID=UPI0030C7FB48
MDNTTLRALLFFLIGGFLLFAGVFVDAMGSSINNDGQNGILPFSPLVLVGRVLLAMGAVMLVGALYLTYRNCKRKKKQAPFDRTSAPPDQSIESQNNTQNLSRPLPARPQSRHMYHPSPGIQMTTYASGTLTNSREAEENPYSEVEGVSSPAAAAFIHYSSTLGARNLGYSRTLGYTRRGVGGGRGNPRILRAGFTPLHPVDEGSSSVHSSAEQLSRYATLPAGQVLDTPEYNWRSHLTREQTRNSTSTPVFKDDPPPYDSFKPPPYRP